MVKGAGEPSTARVAGNIRALEARFAAEHGLVVSSAGLSLNNEGVARAGKLAAASLFSYGDVLVGASVHSHGQATVGHTVRVGGSLHVSDHEDSSSSWTGAATISGVLTAAKGAMFAGGLYLEDGGGLDLRGGGIKRAGTIDMDSSSGSLSSARLAVVASAEAAPCSSADTCAAVVGTQGLRVAGSIHVGGRLFAGAEDAGHVCVSRALHGAEMRGEGGGNET